LTSPRSALQPINNTPRAIAYFDRILAGKWGPPYYFPDYDGTQDRWYAHYIGLKLEDLARVAPIKDKLPCFDRRGDGVISYRFGFTSEGTTGVWVLVFYDTTAFLVTHTKSDTIYKFMESQEKHIHHQGRTKRMQATARNASVVSSTPPVSTST
jgi:hypothetical protein